MTQLEKSAIGARQSVMDRPRMSWKVYKPGQGYWTRLLTGIGAGVLTVGGAVWLTEQLSVIQSDYRLYIVAGVWVVVLGIFGLLTYRTVAVSPRVGDFMIATEGEMKKVNWPVRREVSGATWVVIWTVVLLTVLLYGSDFIFTLVFQWIGILETGG